MSREQIFVTNIGLLIGLLLALAFVLIAVILTWTGLRIWIFHRAQKREAQQQHKTATDAGGHRLPPAGPGICMECGNVFPRVFHLEDGRRLCSTCYSAARSANPKLACKGAPK